MEIIMKGYWGQDTPWIQEAQREAFLTELGKVTRRRLELREQDKVTIELRDPTNGHLTRRSL